MTTDYVSRLKLPINPFVGQQFKFFTSFSGLVLATGYQGIVIGERGPYVEFALSDLVMDSFHIPTTEEWRKYAPNCYYVEWRTTDHYNTKMYQQTRLVDYANYKTGRYYISPFELKVVDPEEMEPAYRAQAKNQLRHGSQVYITSGTTIIDPIRGNK